MTIFSVLYIKQPFYIPFNSKTVTQNTTYLTTNYTVVSKPKCYKQWNKRQTKPFKQQVKMTTKMTLTIHLTLRKTSGSRHWMNIGSIEYSTIWGCMVVRSRGRASIRLLYRGCRMLGNNHYHNRLVYRNMLHSINNSLTLKILSNYISINIY